MIHRIFVIFRDHIIHLSQEDSPVLTLSYHSARKAWPVRGMPTMKLEPRAAHSLRMVKV